MDNSISPKFSWDDIEFHKTFQPQDTYITKILELAAQGYSGTKEEISTVTGIPTGKTSGKVIPHIRYAAFMGLINYEKEGGKYSLSLSRLGEVVYREDKYLYEKITKLICHFNICDKEKGALIWSFLYNQLPNKLDDDIGNAFISSKANEFFGRSVEFSVVKKAYTEGFWQNTRLLNWEENLHMNSQFFSNDCKYVYAYTLLSAWEYYLPDEREISVSRLTDILKWDRRLGFDETETLNVLDEIASEGIITINKQLHPCTIIRIEEADNILNKLYNTLI